MRIDARQHASSVPTELDAAAARNRGFFDILVGRHQSVARAAQVYADRGGDAVDAITQLERPDAYVGLLSDTNAALRLSVFGAGVEPALSDVLRRLVDQRAGMTAHETNPWPWLADTEAELYGDIQRADSDAARRQSALHQATAVTQARALRICRDELLHMARVAIEQWRARHFLGNGWVKDQARAVLRRATDAAIRAGDAVHGSDGARRWLRGILITLARASADGQDRFVELALARATLAAQSRGAPMRPASASTEIRRIPPR